MPKSKRAKIVHMSKTQKKGKELTLRLYANIQECIPKYPYIYVFSVHNMRNTYLKDVRTQLSDSRYASISPFPKFTILPPISIKEKQFWLADAHSLQPLLRQNESNGRRPRPHSRQRTPHRHISPLPPPPRLSRSIIFAQISNRNTRALRILHPSRLRPLRHHRLSNIRSTLWHPLQPRRRDTHRGGRPVGAFD